MKKEKTVQEELRELCIQISTDHFNLTKNIDGNLNYLWFMYSTGVHKGEYRPFILMGEMMLCSSFNLITKEEIDNLMSMLISKDEDNKYIAMKVVQKIMQDRYDKCGKEADSEVYSEIRKNYSYQVLNHEVFMNKYLKP